MPHDSWISTVRFANQNSKQMCLALEMQKIQTKSIFLKNHAEETNIKVSQVQLFILPRQKKSSHDFWAWSGLEGFTQMPELCLVLGKRTSFLCTTAAGLNPPVLSHWSTWIGRFSAIPQPRWWHLVLICKLATADDTNSPQLYVWETTGLKWQE